MNPLDRPLRITIWPDASARAKAEETLSLRQLCGRIRDTTARDKGALPWLKLAEFGDIRTEKGCLRNGRNVGFVWGVEGDYDGKEVSPDEAVQRLQAARLAAVVYTSPSHRPDAPKWRVLCPLADPALSEERESLVARLNGALGGILAGESFTLAQSFYFGSVAGNPAHRVLTVEGRYLDLATDVAPVPKARAERDPVASGAVVLPTDDTAPAVALASACALFDDAADGTGRHQLLLAATNRVARFVAGGYLDRAEAVAVLQGAMAGSGRDANAGEVESALGGAVRCVVVPWYPPVDAADEFARYAVDAPPTARPRGIRLLTPTECAESAPRTYLIKAVLAAGDVGCIFGPPGAGKSILAPHLAYAVAQGRAAFGRRTRPGAAWYVAAEDATGLRQRVHGLKLAHGDAPDMRVVEGCGSFMNDAAVRDLLALVAEHRPTLIILDTVAMAFPGLEENDASSMGRVVNVARALTAHGAAVILVHHDTKAGTGTPRGHSILNGALDMAIMLAKPDESGIVRGVMTKNRNGPCDVPLAFRIPPVTVGMDEDGDAITAPVAVELADAGQRPDKLPRGCSGALAVLREITAQSGNGRVSRVDWRRACNEGTRVSGVEDRESRGRAFTRAAAVLLDRKLIGEEGDDVWVAGGGGAPDEFAALDG